MYITYLDLLNARNQDNNKVIRKLRATQYMNQRAYLDARRWRKRDPKTIFI